MIALLPAPVEYRARALINCGSTRGAGRSDIERPSPFGFGRRGAVGAVVFAFSILAALSISPYCLLIVPLAGTVDVARRIFASNARTQNFERDYPTFLLSLASAIRAGSDPLQAMFGCGDLFAAGSPLRCEVDRVRRAMEQGQREERALQLFGATIAHPDIVLFRTAFILARREGSSLGGCLHRLAKVTRRRQSFRRRAKAAVAMQRLSAFGVAASALLVTVIQSTGNPKALSDAWHHHVGALLLMSGVLLIVAGVVWMLILTRSRT